MGKGKITKVKKVEEKKYIQQCQRCQEDFKVPEKFTEKAVCPHCGALNMLDTPRLYF